MNPGALQFQPSAAARRGALLLAAAGGGLLLLAALLAPQRFWANVLLDSYLLLGLGLGGAFFVALQGITASRWSVAFRRVPEAMAGILPAAGLALLAILLLHPSLYPWVGAGAHGEEALTGFKAFWLRLPFFWMRAALYLVLWTALARTLLRCSRQQDAAPGAPARAAGIRAAALFLVVFGWTFWLASFDWIMSLEPHWYSTLFGVYHFAGLFQAALAALILLLVWLRHRSPLRDFVNPEHFHDLGKLLFAFSTFWMYIWFSQYMLIWYANIPEETSYFIARLHGFWEPLFLLNLTLNWGVPFLVLLPRGIKRSPAALAKVAVVVLLGRWLDLYLMIFPPLLGETPVFGLWEIGSLLAVCGAFLLLFFRSLRQAPLVPVNDPFLSDSLHYHN